MDTVYPEPLSRVLRRTERRPRDRGKGMAGRFRTQPVTFSEIQEVDEENLEDEAGDTNHSVGTVNISKSEHDIKTKVDNMFLTDEPRTPRKRTLKSLNRLSVDPAKLPPSPPPTPAPAPRQLSEPRPSI